MFFTNMNNNTQDVLLYQKYETEIAETCDCMGLQQVPFQGFLVFSSLKGEIKQSLSFIALTIKWESSLQ